MSSKLPDAGQLRRMPPAAIGALLLPIIVNDPNIQARGLVLSDFAIATAEKHYPGQQKTNDFTPGTRSISDILMEGLAFLERTGLLIERTFQGIGHGLWYRLSRDGEDLARRAPDSIVAIGSIGATDLLHPKIATVALPELDRGPDGYADAGAAPFSTGHVA